MTTEEAKKSADEGKKVRKPWWYNGCYVIKNPVLNEDKKYIMCNIMVGCNKDLAILFDAQTLFNTFDTDTNWEILKD